MVNFDISSVNQPGAETQKDASIPNNEEAPSGVSSPQEVTDSNIMPNKSSRVWVWFVIVFLLLGISLAVYFFLF